MNPARSFGPALATGEWTDFWIYVVGPVLGAVLGAFAYQLVRGDHGGERARPDPRAI
jgi:glycerol uptake facilitator-like aquaporin